jgi:hypothetical protein
MFEGTWIYKRTENSSRAAGMNVSTVLCDPYLSLGDLTSILFFNNLKEFLSLSVKIYKRTENSSRAAGMRFY